MFVRSKKRNNKQLFKKSRASSYTTAAAIKKNKKNKLKNKQRSYTLHKRSKGVPVATREELATHVQSVFSDLKEYELGATADGDIEDQLNNNNSHDNVDTHDKGIMKQNSLLLDKHPSLVLNADYQPLRMLPLSTWSWQNTVKAVLSGKAVVVDVYPDLYVRAVSLDIPVPSVIALREYAPTGKAVSVVKCACLVLLCLSCLVLALSYSYSHSSSSTQHNTETSIHQTQRLPPRRLPLPILLPPLPHHRPIPRPCHAPMPRRKAHMGQHRHLLQKVQWTEGLIVAHTVGCGGDGVEEGAEAS